MTTLKNTLGAIVFAFGFAAVFFTFPLFVWGFSNEHFSKPLGKHHIKSGYATTYITSPKS